MEHEEINKFNLIDRYLMGKMLAEERARFEEHFVDCPQCITDLQITKNFMQDLRFVAGEQVSQIDHQPKRASGHFLQMLFRNPLALATGCLLIATAISAFWVIDYTRRLRAEVNQAESLSAQWEKRYENERQSAISAEKQHQEAEAQRAEQLREMEARLKEGEAQRTKMAAESGRQTRPEVNLPMFVLNSLRGGRPNASEANNSITIPRSSARVVFSIPLEEEQLKNYHIKIFDNRKRLIWESRRSTPDPESNSLFIGFKREFFHPGDYHLIVEGGGKGVIGNYSFSIIKAR